MISTLVLAVRDMAAIVAVMIAMLTVMIAAAEEEVAKGKLIAKWA